MTIKLTGEQLNALAKAEWPEGAYVDDETVIIDGDEDHSGEWLSEPVDPKSQVTIDGGILYAEKPNGWGGHEGVSTPFESFVRKWLKSLNSTSIVVEVDNDKAEAVKKAIKASGGRIVA